MSTFIGRLAAISLLAGFATLASAQSPAPDLSSKPVTIVVAYPAGGDTDQLARVFAEKLSPRLGTAVVVENRSGATGVIGSAYVSRAAPDGHTLLLSPGSLPYAQLVLKTNPSNGYDAKHGFVPIIHIGNSPQFLVASPASGFKTFADVVSASKSKSISYATAGVGGIHHIIAEMVNKEAKTSLNHVPYKGVAPAISDVLGGHIPMTYISLGTVKPYLAEKKLIPLAVMDKERSILAPDVPTLWEQGYKLDINTWYGLYGPKGMDPKIAALFNKHLNEIIKLPDVVSRMHTLGAIPVGGSPDDLKALHDSTYVRFGAIIKELAIQAD